MASAIMSSAAAMAAVAAPLKTSNGNGSSSSGNVVSAFTGLKSTAQFPSSMKTNNAGAEWERKTTSNGGRVPAEEQMGALPGIRRGWYHKEEVWKYPWVLRREILGDVEIANVRLHRGIAGVERGERVCEGIPESLHSRHRLRQRPPSPVHLLHRPQARIQLS
uniref:Uncharacterized protein n=1 Tax=Picea sitchensis TaxID=3332 RepID=A9P2A9_PICSI|nr:unknown [Picea sitchensis]